MMRLFLKAMVVCLILLRPAFAVDPAPQSGVASEKAEWIVKAKHLRIRSEPNIHSDVLGVLHQADKVVEIDRTSYQGTIGGKTSYWIKIRARGDEDIETVIIVGWVFGGYLVPPEEGPEGLLARARRLEHTSPEEARMLYRKVIQEYPNTVSDDEIDFTLYSDMARDRMMVLDCYQTKGQDFTTESAEEMSLLLKEALKRKDPNRLLELASCDFTVGACNTDWIQTAHPKKHMAFLAEIKQSIDWSSETFVLGEDYASLHFKSKNGKEFEEYDFSFTKNKEGGWRWDGFCAP